MSDFDPLAYSETQAQGAPPAFDPLAYSAAVVADPARRTAEAAPPSGATKDASNPYDPDRPAIGDEVVNQVHGLASSAYHAIAGGYKGLATLALTRDPDQAAQAVNAETNKTYTPPAPDLSGASPATRPYIERMQQMPSGTELGDFASSHGASPGVSTALAVLPTAAASMAAARGLGPETLAVNPIEQAQAAMNKAASGKSMGAASTAANIVDASPDLQKAIVDTTRKTGGAVNPDVLGRRIEADSLPVRMSLTEGQATQDPAIVSNEMNMRGKHPELATKFNEQNSQLIDNLRAVRETAGPDVFSANPVEHGDALIEAYKNKGAAADADISQKYQALKDANGGHFPVDAQALLENSTKQLHQDLLFDHAPKAVMSTLGRLADNGNMTFENFESLRTNLARIQRNAAADGNEKAAAGVIRQAMEDLPLAPGAAKLKPLADTARAAARAQFDALKADPAYKAAVNDEVPPDRFVQKYIVQAPRDQVATMRQNLGQNERAAQTMGVAALDHLRQQAGIDQLGNGNFSQANFNKHWQAMRPKASSLLPPEQINQLDALGNVARYTQFQPRGSFVNNSNTLVGALASHGANALEGMANVKAGGIPVGSIVRKAIGKRAEEAAVKRALDPASGLERLKETD